MGGQDRSWSLVVPHHPSGASQARQQLAAELDGLVSSGLCADAVAVAAELLGNAVRHATPLPGNVIRLACVVHIDGRHSRVELRVFDGGSTLVPTERRAGPDAVDGRGLAIVAALAGEWGVDRASSGQCVWARLGGPPADQQG